MHVTPEISNRQDPGGTERVLRMARWARRIATALVASAIGTSVTAQLLPLEIPQESIRYNLQSTNGVPISSTYNQPPGSDGRAPTVQQQEAVGLTTVPATPQQFQTLQGFAALAAPQSANLASGLSLFENAENLNLPRVAENQVVMLRARVGVTLIGRQISFRYGQVIPQPETDEYGVLLSEVNDDLVPPRPPQSPSDYWLAEPYSTNEHAGAGYYWSPHAQRVYATQQGPIAVAWRTSQPSASSGSLPPDVTLVAVSGSDYHVLSKSYFVSGSPVKPPRTIYWTEGAFRATGKPVSVPAARVGAVNILYNNNFPERVDSEVEIPGYSLVVTTNRLEETRTLWYDQTLGQIQAYNVEGRVFLELLGDSRPNQTRQHLGFEIVDSIRQPNPADVTIELGERVTAYADGEPDDRHLIPEPIMNLQQTYAFQFNPGGADEVQYFATRETENINDFQVHWLEEGVEGLRWPNRFVRYSFVWPGDVTRYSHFIRPLVSSEEEAQATAVQLPTENAPFIEYQDPLDQPRGKLTEEFAYYSFVTPQYPAHRALLRLVSGENIRFERVFSWLDENLRNQDFADSVATELDTWDPATGAFDWPEGLEAPRTFETTVRVGDRIMAPPGELGSGAETDYLAGHLVRSYGDSFSPSAYIDPFVEGFEAANAGAIIPVNAIPGGNRLEVLWFRRNAVDLSLGFLHVFWPSVIGRYTIEWPVISDEIVLASNDGSGPLPSLLARGAVYFQNDASLPGYNPNEEHALMQGGQVFALRDDLNIVTGPGYSSQPFVLLQYTKEDSRPAMRVFQMLREKPEEGLVFDYPITAGTPLEGPMPLPLLERPLAPPQAGQPPMTLNAEVQNAMVETSTDAAPYVLLQTVERHFFRPYRLLSLEDIQAAAPVALWFYPLDGQRITRGVVSDRRPVNLFTWGGTRRQTPCAGASAAKILRYWPWEPSLSLLTLKLERTGKPSSPRSTPARDSSRWSST